MVMIMLMLSGDQNAWIQTFQVHAKHFSMVIGVQAENLVWMSGGTKQRKKTLNWPVQNGWLPRTKLQISEYFDLNKW